MMYDNFLFCNTLYSYHKLPTNNDNANYPKTEFISPGFDLL